MAMCEWEREKKKRKEEAKKSRSVDKYNVSLFATIYSPGTARLARVFCSARANFMNS